MTHDVIHASIRKSQTCLEQSKCKAYTIHCILLLLTLQLIVLTVTNRCYVSPCLVYILFCFVALLFLCRVKEACILLNLLPGSAVLLRNLLKSSETNVSEEEGASSSCAALQDTGVYRLTAEDALKVLNLRVQLPIV